MKSASSPSLALLAVVAAAACARHSGDVSGLRVGKQPLFETRIEIPTGSGGHSDFRLADFNGDGWLDLAVIGVTGDLRVLLGNGAAYVPGQALQLDGLPVWIAGGDFDQDQDEDLVVVRATGETADILLNDGNGTFSPGGSLAIGPDGLSLAVGDLDGDGLLDVAVSQPSVPQIRIGYGDGAGGFASSESIVLPGGGEAFFLAIGDLTRDGAADLCVSDPVLSRVVVFPGQPPLAAVGFSYLELYVPGNPSGMAFGELSGDGLPDLVVGASNAGRYVVITDLLGPIGKGQPGGGEPWDYASFEVPVPEPPSIPTVGDVTGDGVNDLVACLAYRQSMCIARGLPGGGVGAQYLLDTSGSPLRPAVGDHNRDGRADLLTLSAKGDRINLWLADSDGRLRGARNYVTGVPLAAWVEGGDFDGDGDLEVVTGGTDDTHVVFLAPDGAGGLTIQSTVDVGFPVNQFDVVDLDGDGRPELVVAVPGGLRVLRNRSSAGVYDFEVMPAPPTSMGANSLPYGIEVADFDRDGSFDVVLCDFLGGGLHLLPGTATPFLFAPEVVLPLGNAPAGVAAGDFTGDGLVDLAVARFGQSDIVVLKNEGGLAFSEFLTIPVGLAPTYLLTADFDRDGRADLVVSNGDSDTVSVLFGGPNGFTGQSYPAGNNPMALLVRDLSGDGIEDILVASLQSGDFRVLVGDGAGGFPLLPRFPGTLGASDALLQDVTGDGLPDLMISSVVTSRLSVVRNITD